MSVKANSCQEDFERMTDTSAKHPFYEETIETKPVFQGRMISLQVDTVRLPNGETATREIVRHPGAVAVIALLDNRLLVVEQYRKPVERVQVEIPAGKLEPGEDPLEAAGRELEEETGYRAKKLTHLQSFSTSPGFAEEIVHLYFTDELEKGEVHLDEEEFLTCEAISMEEALRYIREGRICDAKTLMAVYAWQLREATGSLPG
jgi:ADP-ribose pyrophosphatase